MHAIWDWIKKSFVGRKNKIFSRGYECTFRYDVDKAIIIKMWRGIDRTRLYFDCSHGEERFIFCFAILDEKRGYSYAINSSIENLETMRDFLDKIINEHRKNTLHQQFNPLGDPWAAYRRINQREV